MAQEWPPPGANSQVGLVLAVLVIMPQPAIRLALPW